MNETEFPAVWLEQKKKKNRSIKAVPCLVTYHGFVRSSDEDWSISQFRGTDLSQRESVSPRPAAYLTLAGHQWLAGLSHHATTEAQLALLTTKTNSRVWESTMGRVSSNHRCEMRTWAI